MVCMNCGKKEAYHIADGLYLCPACEKVERFWHLVQDADTKKIFWKNLDLTLSNEVIVD